MAAAPYRFLYATTGDGALRLPRESPPVLWLINFRLPDMNGAELLALVRSRDPASACVLVGDIYSSADELSARQLGATIYGCKPPQAAWLQAVPTPWQRPLRDHLAHGPPETRLAPAILQSGPVGPALRPRPRSSEGEAIACIADTKKLENTL